MLVGISSCGTLLYYGGHSFEWIQKQGAAGVVVDRKVAATSAVDALAEVQFHWE